MKTFGRKPDGLRLERMKASLLWAGDPRAGAIQLLFFLLPFGALLAVVARAPAAGWWPRSLAATLVALACGFAAVGLSQL